jgi:hypothetical protein
MHDANNKTYELIKRWGDSRRILDRQKQMLMNAECDLANTTNALGKALVPSDAKSGEQFSIWANGEPLGIPGDVLFTVSRIGNDYKIMARK